MVGVRWGGQVRAIGTIGACVAVLAALALELARERADAAFPGRNGEIAFISNRDGDYEIFTMNASGHRKHRLTKNSVDEFSPSYSANGRWIVYTRRSGTSFEIWKMRSNGTHKRRLTETVNGAVSGGAFAPSGRWIAFGGTSSNPSFATDQIFRMEADGKHRRNLSRSEHPQYAPAVSPNGKRIAYYTFPDPTGEAEIGIMDADGSHQHVLTDNDAIEGAPSFSPSGKRLIFSFTPSSGDADLVTMRLNGAGLHRIADTAVYENYGDFSPNGRRVGYDQTTGTPGKRGIDDPEIFVMTARGKHRRPLTDNTVNDYYGDWRPR